MAVRLVVYSLRRGRSAASKSRRAGTFAAPFPFGKKSITSASAAICSADGAPAEGPVTVFSSPATECGIGIPGSPNAVNALPDPPPARGECAPRDAAAAAAPGSRRRPRRRRREHRRVHVRRRRRVARGPRRRRSAPPPARLSSRARRELRRRRVRAPGARRPPRRGRRRTAAPAPPAPPAPPPPPPDADADAICANAADC